MGVMWPRSSSYEFDDNGERAIGALARFFVGTTSTPLAVYTNAAETTPFAVTVATDGNGRWPAVFIPFGTYSLTITTAGGTTLFQASGIPNPAPTDPGVGVDANAIYQTGDFIIVGKNSTRPGAVRCNGRTLGSAASGATERANADAAALFAFIWDNYANGQCAVSTGRGASAAADFAANKTITLPDYRGACLTGFDDMGSTAASLYGTAPVITGSGILAGSVVGANTHIITEAQLAAHTHTLGAVTVVSNGAHTHTGTTGINSVDHVHSGTTSTESQTHTHTYGTANTKTGLFQSASGGQGWSVDVGATTGNASVTHTHTVTTGIQSQNHTHAFTMTTDGAHTHTLTGSPASIGSGTAHNIMARSAPITILMKL